MLSSFDKDTRNMSKAKLWIERRRQRQKDGEKVKKMNFYTVHFSFVFFMLREWETQNILAMILYLDKHQSFFNFLEINRTFLLEKNPAKLQNNTIQKQYNTKTIQYK